jgi:AcrR family transcriptional regulator
MRPGDPQGNDPEVLSMTVPAQTSARTRRPSGREEIRRVVLEAATRLFGERGPANVTVRDVAAAAGVQHSVVHRYFGTKEELFREVIAQGAREEALVLNDPTANPEDQLRYTLARTSYSRALLWASLEGWDLTQFADSESERRAMQLTQSGHLRPAGDHPGFDPRLVIGLLAASTYGWIAMGDRIKRQMGLQDLSDDEFIDSLSQLMMAIMALADDALRIG